MGFESLSAQLEAVRLNGVCTNSLLENLIEMVLKLSDEVGHLRIDNQSLKAKIESIAGAARPYVSSCVLEPLSGRDVTSTPTKTSQLRATMMYYQQAVLQCPGTHHLLQLCLP
jgi:hypothetical protein